MEKSTMPVIFGELGPDGIRAGPVTYSRGRFSVSEAVPLASIKEIRPAKERGTVVLADAESLSSGRFSPRFVERCKVPGNDVWLIESIRDEADILDAFLPGLGKLIIPVHSVGSFQVLESAIDMSDDCIPLIVTDGGRAFGKEGDPLKVLENVCSAGFPSAMVMDLDGSLKEDVWHMMCDRCDTIPFSPFSGNAADRRTSCVFPFIRG